MLVGTKSQVKVKCFNLFIDRKTDGSLPMFYKCSVIDSPLSDIFANGARFRPNRSRYANATKSASKSLASSEIAGTSVANTVDGTPSDHGHRVSTVKEVM